MAATKFSDAIFQLKNIALSKSWTGIYAQLDSVQTDLSTGSLDVDLNVEITETAPRYTFNIEEA